MTQAQEVVKGKAHRAARRLVSRNPAPVMILTIAALAGFAASLAPPSPTGRPGFDAALVGGLVAVIAALAARAPAWTVTLAVGSRAHHRRRCGCDVRRRNRVGDRRRGGMAVAAPISRAGHLGGDRCKRNGVGRAGRAFRPHRFRLDRGCFGGRGHRDQQSAPTGTPAGVRRCGRCRRLRRRVDCGFGIAALRAKYALAEGLHLSEQADASLEHGDFTSAAGQFARCLRPSWIGPTAPSRCRGHSAPGSFLLSPSIAMPRST